MKSKRNVCRCPARTCAFKIGSVVGQFFGARQVVVERFNYEINVRVLIPVRGALFRLESLRLLDKTRETHVGAVQFIALPLMQYGCDLLRLAWNEHKRRRIRGVLGSGGRPEDLRLSHPHPGGQMQLVPGFHAVAEYERASGRLLRRVPRTAALRDRCFYRRSRARRRARGEPTPLGGLAHVMAASIPHFLVLLAAVRHILGSDAHLTWTELQRGKYRRFIRAYRVFLQFR